MAINALYRKMDYGENINKLLADPTAELQPKAVDTICQTQTSHVKYADCTSRGGGGRGGARPESTLAGP